MSVVCTLTRNIGDEWFLIKIQEKEVGYMYSHSGDWCSDLHYVDGEFDFVSETSRERMITLTCVDGLPLVLSVEVASKVPVFGMVLSRGETLIQVPFPMCEVREAIEMSQGEVKTESQIHANVVDYLFPGKDDIAYIPSEPTQQQIDSLLKSQGWKDVLEVAVQWYRSTGTHNHFLYAIEGEAFGLLLRLLTDWKSVEITQLPKITIKALSYRQCLLLTFDHRLIGLGQMVVEVLKLLTLVTETRPKLAKEYLHWSKAIWTQRERQWTNKELALDITTSSQKSSLQSLEKRIGELPS